MKDTQATSHRSQAPGIANFPLTLRNRPKILFSPDIFSFQRVGGVTRYFRELIAGLQAQRYDPKVLCGLHVSEGADELALGGWKLPASVPAAARRRIAAASREGLELSIPFRTADVYHKTYYLGRRSPGRAKVVVTVYDMIHELFPQEFDPNDPSSAQKRYWCAQADLILVVSETTRADLLRLTGADPNKVRVTPLGVRLFGNTESTEYASSPNVAGGESNADLQPFLLYVGSRHGYKNFDSVIRALSVLRHKNERVSVVCFGGPPLTSAELATIRASRCEGSVSWRTGPDNALRDLYRTAAAYVCPSRYEGFGLPALEAIAHGCPVLSAAAGSLPEILGDAAEFFEPADPRSLITSIERVLADGDRRAKLTAKGLQRAALYPWERTVDSTVAAYEWVLGV